MPSVPDIRIHSDGQAVAHAAAELIQEVGKEAVRAKGRFCIALSGGTTPEILYRALTSPVFAGCFDWSKAIFFFSDERCVPPNDPRSNYALADKTLFTPLNILPSQIYRMAGESSDPQAAASEYEQQLRLATKTVPSAQPALDLILLGLGEDGHTASLFPGASILRDHQRAIAATQSPKDPPNRLTMTLAAINRASVVLFLATGVSKAGVVRAILDPKNEAERQLPASLVKPEEGRLIWLLDRAAAADLPMQSQRTGA
ncbi:MAG: 6-phosphogluconolactonase [Nitrospiraceae bacterium]|nr:MAG: 6-phosphogluconolactonase [Nitrospiraceae bacterium]